MPLQPNDRPEFLRLLTTTGKYYRVDMTPDLLEMYWTGLEQFDLAAIRQALNAHVANPDTGQFMPKIADIVRALGGTTQDAALLAWAKVHRAIRLVGAYMDVAFDDPLIHWCINDMGGWVRLCQTSEDELPFRAKEFENRYRGGMRGTLAVPIASVPRLIGIANAHNEAKGLPSTGPVLIGNAQAAQAIVDGTAPALTALKRIK